jgi:hypothetical protein
MCCFLLLAATLLGAGSFGRVSLTCLLGSVLHAGRVVACAVECVSSASSLPGLCEVLPASSCGLHAPAPGIGRWTWPLVASRWTRTGRFVRN